MDKVEYFNFLKYADDYGIEYTTHAGNLSKGWLLAMDCVFCGHHNGKHHLGIPNEGNRSFCWSCGSHSLYETLKALTPSVNYYTLLETYSGWIDDRALLKKKKVPHVESVPFEFDALGKVARKYLEKRGFDPSFLEEKYKMRDGGQIGDFRYRVVVPIIYEGAVVAYQGRSYNSMVEPKYRFLPEEKCAMNPKHIFFNLDNARGDHVIITEGVFDSIKLAGEDCKNVIASLGISTTEEQVTLLSKRFKKVSMCYDPEKTARVRARKMAVKLSALGVEACVIDTERDYDLGDSSWEECKTLKEEILG